MTENKKVLILSTRLTGGGAEAISTLMGESLKNSRLVIYENVDGYNYGSDNLYDIDVSACSGVFGKVKNFLTRYVKIQKLIFEFNPDVIISHLTSPNLINILSVSKAKKVIYIHNVIGAKYNQDYEYYRTHLFLIGLMYKRADLLVGVSSEICNELRVNYDIKKKKILFIKNPIDPYKLDELRKDELPYDLSFLKKEKFVVNIASLSQQKGQVYLLRIISRLRECGNSIKLIIIGEGELRNNLIKEADDLKLKLYDYMAEDNKCLVDESDVVLLGYQNNPIKFLQYSTLFLMPSLWEGLPVSLLEAIYCKTPVVISDCSEGIKQVVAKDYVKDKINGIMRISPGYLIENISNINQDIVVGYWVKAIDNLVSHEGEYRNIQNNYGVDISSFYLRQVVSDWRKMLIDG